MDALAQEFDTPRAELEADVLGFCGEIVRRGILVNRYSFNDHFMSLTQSSSLVLASLDIGRVLADRDGVTFRSQGMCMSPTMRPGDVLRIEPRIAMQVQIGDIAVCRGHDYLFSHRVIGKGECAGRAFIVTRPDRSYEGSDGPTFDENLLGVVVTITRNGKRVPLPPTAYPFLLRQYYRARIGLIEARSRAWWWLVNMVARWQTRAWYCWLARRWFALARPRVSFVVRVPLRATDAIYQHIPAAEFKPTNGEWQGRKLERWMLALHFNADKEPVALALFVPGDDGWQMQETQVRVRYRGMGLEEMLAKKSDDA